MQESSLQRFVTGAIAGAIAAVFLYGALTYALSVTGLVIISVPELPGLHALLNLVYDNLRLSVIPFGITLFFYVLMLRRLRKELQDKAPVVDTVAHIEYLLDISVSLFFGIGVIWTAIGMRSALLYALGDPGVAIDQGSFVILQRMVEGGILLALSTTIVGGIGGYLMRVGKVVSIGSQLQQYYNSTSASQGKAIYSELCAIKRHLDVIARQNKTEEPT